MNYNLIGWHYDPDANSDKIWGIIPLREGEIPSRYDPKDEEHRTGDFVVFHGRRGQQLKTKIVRNIEQWLMKKNFRDKKFKGYRHVNPSKVGQVYPGFTEDLEKIKIWALLQV